MTIKTDKPIIFGNKPGTGRSVKTAFFHGLKKKCPQCGKGKLFNGYTKVKEACASCGLDYSGQQADDAPPYFTMLITGHLVIPIALEFKRHLDPPLGLQFLIWGIVMAVMIWLLLPITKGGLIGIQWANKMHGFSDTGKDETIYDLANNQTNETT